MSKDSLGIARCGRCAQILPDETMTYCLSCGTPFSKIPPTHQYQLFDERLQSTPHKVRAYLLGLSKLYLALCLMSLLVLAVLENRWAHQAKHLQAFPNLEIYTYEFPDGPMVEKLVGRQAIGVALQSFEDHFGATFKQVSIFENTLPEEMKFLQTKEGLFLSRDLSFWDQVFFKTLTSDLKTRNRLKVFITNIPIYAQKNGESEQDIEISHLGESQLVSGLGHPAYVVVSTYRMLTRAEEYKQRTASLSSASEQARFLGEYLLAHEWGHALLGLKDYVLDFRTLARAPASETGTMESFEECLMHSDQGGGFLAWKQIKARPLGTPSKCKSYAAVTEAFRLRSEAIRFLKQGRRAEAEALHHRAIQLAKGSAQGWVGDLWQREHPLFQSMVRRWINAIFVVKLGNDSSRSQP